MITGVFVDANVLFSRTLRDWLFLLKLESGGGAFSVRVTEDVMAETMYRLRRRHPEWDGAKISRLRRQLETSVDEIVEQFRVDESYPGRDPNDAHVHAAAVACDADVLLTDDNGWHDLPEEELDRLPYEIHTADSFFVLCDNSMPDTVRRVLVEQSRYYWRRRGEVDLVEHLRKAGCPLFAERVRRHLQTMDPSTLVEAGR